MLKQKRDIMLQFLQEKVGAISYFPTGIHFKGPVSSKKLFTLPAIMNFGNEVGKKYILYL